MNSTETSAPRTVGLSLAIIASIVMYTALPVLQLIWLAALDARLRANLDAAGDAGTMLTSGASWTGLSDGAVLAQVVLSAVFLLIAALAWRGRPAWSRWALIAAVLLMAALSILPTIAGALTPPDAAAGYDAGQQIARGTVGCTLALQCAVPLYIVWYMSRRPARDYYRSTAARGAVDRSN